MFNKFVSSTRKIKTFTKGNPRHFLLLRTFESAKETGRASTGRDSHCDCARRHDVICGSVAVACNAIITDAAAGMSSISRTNHKWLGKERTTATSPVNNTNGHIWEITFINLFPLSTRAQKSWKISSTTR